jgi:hypothetical protein
LAKADGPNTSILESGSKLKLERFVHPPKQDSEIRSIDEGMQTEGSAQQRINAQSLKIEIWQRDSNTKFESIPPAAKHALEIVPTDEGIQME